MTEEHFRVGYDYSSDRITLTLLGDSGQSMTLSMAEAGVRHLIKMLEAAIPETINLENV